jgi:hypothetical protein
MVFLTAALVAASLGVPTEGVPLPQPRPSITQTADAPTLSAVAVETEHGPPTDCDKRLAAMAVFTPKPTLRCDMAESFAAWLRDEAVPRLKPLNSPLRTVVNEDSYECRGRNRVAGAKVSEHGKGNAIDVRGFILADRRKIVLTDVTESKDLREGLRDSACRRFTTVLGPGSDAYHEQHIHLDVLERRAGYRICQWAVREPTPPAMVASGEAVPLPPPRPPVPETRKL